MAGRADAYRHEAVDLQRRGDVIVVRHERGEFAVLSAPSSVPRESRPCPWPAMIGRHHTLAIQSIGVSSSTIFFGTASEHI